ncbi:MAG: Eco57I restriction-modification methylase domain-containing protein, partial [Candidatus Omnitrophica bacterium]|nr:Eco57I restriction-modification methylase domain-containing protein [Candidatus Omnitrophota bacterium]
GNPPYIRIQTMKEWAPLEVEYYKQRYTAASKGNYDIYVVFVERGLSLLNKEGRLGFILPHKFFNAQYGEPLRAFIAKGRHLSHVVHFGDQQVFIGATTYTCLLFLDKVGNNQCQFAKVDDLSEWHSTGKVAEGIISAASITASEWSFTVGKNAELFERLSKMPVKLGNVATRMYQGPITSADTVYLFKEFRTEKLKKVTNVFSKELSEWIEIESDILKPVIRSGSINRYRAEPTALVLFPYEVKDCTARLFSLHEMQNNYPLAWDYLNRNRKLLESREKGKFRDTQWHRFGRTQNLGMWEQPKLMIPYMITNLAAYFDQSDNYYFINVTTGGYGIICDEKSCNLTYLCGLLNSHLLDLYFKKVSTNFHGGYFAANKQYIEQLPIRIINFSNPDDKARHDRMVALVDQMLELHKQLASAKTDHDKTVIQRQIDATDRQIDLLVYELYGLTEDEIKIVEEGSP